MIQNIETTETTRDFVREDSTVTLADLQEVLQSEFSLRDLKNAALVAQIRADRLTRENNQEEAQAFQALADKIRAEIPQERDSALL